MPTATAPPIRALADLRGFGGGPGAAHLDGMPGTLIDDTCQGIYEMLGANALVRLDITYPSGAYTPGEWNGSSSQHDTDEVAFYIAKWHLRGLFNVHFQSTKTSDLPRLVGSVAVDCKAFAEDVAAHYGTGGTFTDGVTVSGVGVVAGWQACTLWETPNEMNSIGSCGGAYQTEAAYPQRIFCVMRDTAIGLRTSDPNATITGFASGAIAVKTATSATYDGRRYAYIRDVLTYADTRGGLFGSVVQSSTAAGSTTLVLDDNAPTVFDAGGGTVWVNGQSLTYTSRSGNTLSGIPASGTGHITATIPAGSVASTDGRHLDRVSVHIYQESDPVTAATGGVRELNTCRELRTLIDAHGADLRFIPIGITEGVVAGSDRWWADQGRGTATPDHPTYPAAGGVALDARSTSKVAGIAAEGPDSLFADGTSIAGAPDQATRIDRFHQQIGTLNGEGVGIDMLTPHVVNDERPPHDAYPYWALWQNGRGPLLFKRSNTQPGSSPWRYVGATTTGNPRTGGWGSSSWKPAADIYYARSHGASGSGAPQIAPVPVPGFACQVQEGVTGSLAFTDPGVDKNTYVEVTIVKRTTGAPTAPAGWTLVDSAARSTIVDAYVYGRVIDHTETWPYTWSGLGVNDQIGVLAAYWYVDPTTPVGVTATPGVDGGSAGTDLATGTLTTSQDKSLVVAGFCSSAGGHFTTASDGVLDYAEFYDQKEIAGTNCSEAVSTATQDTHGAVASATSTGGSGRWIAFLRALNGAPVAPPAISSGPGDGTTETEPTFAFALAQTGDTLEVDIDGGGYASASTDFTVGSPLAAGTHVLKVVSIRGGVRSSPRTYTWLQDTGAPTVPEPAIDTAPASVTTARTGVFTFHDTGVGNTLYARVDGGAWEVVTTSLPVPIGGGLLDIGAHLFELKANDGTSDSIVNPYPWSVVDDGPATAPGTRPTYRVELALGAAQIINAFRLGISVIGDGSVFAGTFGSSVLDDITNYDAGALGKGGVRGVTITRGRSDANASVGAGTCSIDLADPAGYWNPENVDSPYYGQVDPLRPARVFATYAGVDYPLFRGYLRRLVAAPNVGEVSATMELVDLFDWLSRAKPVFPATGMVYAGDAIGVILDACNLTDGSLRSLDQGVLIAGVEGDGTTDGLSIIGSILEADGGIAYVDVDGRVVFESRHASPMKSSVATLTSAVQNYNPSLDADAITNRATVTGADGVEVTAEDDDSINRFGPRDANAVQSALILNETHALSLARFLVNRGASPRPPAWGVKTTTGLDDLVLPLLMVDLQNVVTVDNLDGKLGIVEGITHHISDGGLIHEAEWALSDWSPAPGSPSGSEPFRLGLDHIGDAGKVFVS